MRGPLDQPLMVILLGVGGLAMGVPASHAVTVGAYPVARAFFYCGLMILAFCLLLAVALNGYRPRNVARSHLVQLAGAYLLVPLALCLPLLRLFPELGLVQAWLEMVSCLTTTGASLLSDMPPTVQLWRALVGWMGGFLTLVAALSILAPMNLGGFEVVFGQSAGRGLGVVQGRQRVRIPDPSLRMKRYSGQILLVYAGLTLMLWLGLVLAGDPALAGLIRAMSTLSTSGIQLADVPANRLVEGLVVVFLVFALSRQAMPGARHRLSGPLLYQETEFRLALSILLVLGLALLTYQATGADNLSGLMMAAWSLIFTLTSFLTTTGFVSQDWAPAALWSGLPVPGLILAALALAGGGVATTAGGVKLIRLSMIYSHAVQELRHQIYPHSVGSSGQMPRPVRQQAAMVSWMFAMLFLLSVAATMLLLTLFGLGFEPALVLAIAALTSCGPLADVGTALPISWAGHGDAANMVLGLAMVLGRLETLALIALLDPENWQE